MSKWKERIPGIVISVILVAVFAVFMVILLQSKMVPTKLLILGGIALVLLVASAVLLVRSIRNKPPLYVHVVLHARQHRIERIGERLQFLGNPPHRNGRQVGFAPSLDAFPQAR